MAPPASTPPPLLLQSLCVVRHTPEVVLLLEVTSWPGVSASRGDAEAWLASNAPVSASSMLGSRVCTHTQGLQGLLSQEPQVRSVRQKRTPSRLRVPCVSVGDTYVARAACVPPREARCIFLTHSHNLRPAHLAGTSWSHSVLISWIYCCSPSASLNLCYISVTLTPL